MSSRFLRAAVMACALASPLLAQPGTATNGFPFTFANDALERYARVLQAHGDIVLHQWSIRGFGPRELERFAADSGPWAGQFGGRTRTFAGIHATALPVRSVLIFNSSFPFGYNDGAVWAGRGLTSVVTGGVILRHGVLSLSLAPTIFRAENAPFTMRATGQPGDGEFADAFDPGRIDQPQRFGASPYHRIAPGNSTIRIDVAGATAGFSSADQVWGPATDHPLILGNNAAGFPHVFIGTSEPVRLPMVDVHARVLWGRLEQSRFMPGAGGSRLGTGVVAVILPRFFPGLEVGGARFFHVAWSDSVLSARNLQKPLSALFKFARIGATDNAHGNEGDNQLASVFARWVFPQSGFEAYAEYAREDHSWNARDFVLEPDHIAGFTLGFLRAWGSGSELRSAMRVEVANTRISPLHLVRPQAPFYVHSPLNQGHTNEGQVMGSVGGYGGGAATVAFDRYTPSGRWTLGWSRIMRAERLDGANGMPMPQEADVAHSLTFEGMRRAGRLGIIYEVTGVYELNRNFGDDAFNARLATGVQYAW